jgi:hypothetical protein
MTTRTAACACGQLRIVCDGEPTWVAACHCTACQRRTGSAYSVNAYYAKQGMNIEGTSKVFTRRSDAGRDVRLHFCPRVRKYGVLGSRFSTGPLGGGGRQFCGPVVPETYRGRLGATQMAVALCIGRYPELRREGVALSATVSLGAPARWGLNEIVRPCTRGLTG